MSVGLEANGTALPESWRTAIEKRVMAVVGGKVNGRRATAAMLASVLIYAATTRTSLFGTCESMAVADDNTLRDHLNRLAKGDEIWELTARINEQLHVGRLL